MGSMSILILVAAGVVLIWGATSLAFKLAVCALLLAVAWPHLDATLASLPSPDFDVASLMPSGKTMLAIAAVGLFAMILLGSRMTRRLAVVAGVLVVGTVVSSRLSTEWLANDFGGVLSHVATGIAVVGVALLFLLVAKLRFARQSGRPLQRPLGRQRAPFVQPDWDDPGAWPLPPTRSPRSDLDLLLRKDGSDDV